MNPPNYTHIRYIDIDINYIDEIKREAIMRIALFIAGMNGNRLDRGLHTRVREIRFVQEQKLRKLWRIALSHSR